MSFLDPFFTFSNEDEYKAMLWRKLQLLSQYNEIFSGTTNMQYDFLQGDQCNEFVLKEIYPQFHEIYNPENFKSNVFSELSQYAIKKISMQIDEETFMDFNQMRDLFIILSSFEKYPSFIRNPSESLPFVHQLRAIRSILYDKICDKQIFLDFLPLCSTQNLFDIHLLWNRCSSLFNIAITNESVYILKRDDSKVILSSRDPEICSEENRNLIKENQSLALELQNQFSQVNEIFENIKTGFQSIQQLFTSHQNILIQILPINSVLKILDEEGYSLFKKPEIKINRIDLTTNFLFDFGKFENLIKLLENDYNERCQFESYIRNKYHCDISYEDTRLHIENYTKIKKIIDFFNEMIENIDVFDDCIPNISFFSSFFSDIEKCYFLFSKNQEIESLSSKIECLLKIIEKKNKKIECIKKETDSNLQIAEQLRQNLSIFEDYKEHVVHCELCRTNRSYVLINCGHSFCDSCYQYFCSLDRDDLKCPFCETPFTFDKTSIIKINWTSNKTNEEEEDDDDE